MSTETVATSQKIAAFFDLDKTIIAKSSALLFTSRLLSRGYISKRTAMKATIAHLLYRLSGADEAQLVKLRDQIRLFCTGWDVAEISLLIREALDDLVTPLVYAEARAWLTEHLAAGHDVIIASSTAEQVALPIAELLGIPGGKSNVIATQLTICDGHFTGGLDNFVSGAVKAERITALAIERGYQLENCYAYSDSISDLPMLDLVGHPVAVNPDRALRTVARERGWKLESFAHPVPLTTRLRNRSQPLLAVTALSAFALGVAGWALYRHRANRP